MVKDARHLLPSPLHAMDAFSLNPPEWTNKAVHALVFCCPTCRAASTTATNVWLNRRSPVYGNDHRKKWQEFYHCECGTVWWAWSSDRTPNEYANDPRSIGDQRQPAGDTFDFDPFDY